SGWSSLMDPDARTRGRRLDSWKQIARYLNRHVTTVRRWERSERLPVHRHLHMELGSIYAYTDELDAWFEGRRRDYAERTNGSMADVGPAHPERDDDAARIQASSGAKPRLGLPRRGIASWRYAVAGALALTSFVVAAWMAQRPAAEVPGASADQFLRAEFFINRRQPGDLARAEAAYRQVLVLQPRSARAWAGLAGVYYIAA